VKRILHDLPFYEESQLFYLQPPPGFVRILHRQIPVRISLAHYVVATGEFVPMMSSFPAILDTGFNGGVAITRSHLSQWAGLASTSLVPEIKRSTSHEAPTIRGFPARSFESRFYVRPNRRHSWEPSAEQPVEVVAKIFLVDAPNDSFRLPLLGMSALDQLGRTLTIDYRRRLVQL
jgi:hypothetical protein